MNVVIVESPAKAKTINTYLGPDYIVLASYGHVRDLPARDGSVRPDEGFAMDWETQTKAGKNLKKIAEAVKGADSLILATDPDREGEAISWHVLEVLKKRRLLKDIRIKRVAFNAITKKAVQEAMTHPRELNMELVEAYLARRALDYLVGFTLSPVLWRKLPGARSAGRVQSVALRLICERETEIEAFKPREYWTVDASLHHADSPVFKARLVQAEGKKFTKFSLPSEIEAEQARKQVEQASLEVLSFETKPGKRSPAPPFTTSTLQQEAGRKLGFSASQTMGAAQKLYETGLITYMRTDSVHMEPGAIQAARQEIEKSFGKKYCPSKPRLYASKAKNAQEAHEAIRPTDFTRHPDATSLTGETGKLYALIWKRALASQMADALLERAVLETGEKTRQLILRATGSVLTFDGFLCLYREGQDDTEEEGEKRLPKLEPGLLLQIKNVLKDQHFTQPPPRFTEASLVKTMEELGIGRPSTYASTLSLLRDRGYVHMDKKRFVPDDKGRLVTAFLDNFFHRYIQYDFTADLEGQLDHVSQGKLGWKHLLEDFWRDFITTVKDLDDVRITEVLDRLNEALGPHIFPDPGDGSDPRLCPKCQEGSLSLKVGRHGSFIGCSRYPECHYTRPLNPGKEGEAGQEIKDDGSLGQDPETGLDVFLKNGRFGSYVQLGEGEKPKRSSIPKGWGDMSLEAALRLLSLPRTVGQHPETGKPITAGLGRYGPYLLHDGVYANLKEAEELFTIDMNRAVSLLAEKSAKTKKGLLKDLGENPKTGQPVKLMDGRYGPYVQEGRLNASLAKHQDPQSLSLEEALTLLEDKAKSKKNRKAPTRKKAGA